MHHIATDMHIRLHCVAIAMTDFHFQWRKKGVPFWFIPHTFNHETLHTAAKTTVSGSGENNSIRPEEMPTASVSTNVGHTANKVYKLKSGWLEFEDTLMFCTYYIAHIQGRSRQVIWRLWLETFEASWDMKFMNYIMIFLSGLIKKINK